MAKILGVALLSFVASGLLVLLVAVVGLPLSDDLWGCDGENASNTWTCPDGIGYVIPAAAVVAALGSLGVVTAARKWDGLAASEVRPTLGSRLSWTVTLCMFILGVMLCGMGFTNFSPAFGRWLLPIGLGALVAALTVAGAMWREKHRVAAMAEP